jgi:ankyrin repeat protein
MYSLLETERALMMRICSLLVGDPRYLFLICIISYSIYLSFCATVLTRSIEVDAKDKKGRTPLSVAARAGLNSVVDMLLRNRANPNLSTHVMRTPLHYACLSGYTGVVILLLEGGAWLEACDKRYSRNECSGGVGESAVDNH